MTTVIYTWNTTKVGNHFEYVVKMLTPSNEKLADGTYCKSEEIKRGVAASRAIAKSKGQAWVRYYKAARLENK